MQMPAIMQVSDKPKLYEAIVEQREIIEKLAGIKLIKIILLEKNQPVKVVTQACGV